MLCRSVFYYYFIGYLFHNKLRLLTPWLSKWRGHIEILIHGNQCVKRRTMRRNRTSDHSVLFSLYNCIIFLTNMKRKRKSVYIWKNRYIYIDRLYYILLYCIISYCIVWTQIYNTLKLQFLFGSFLCLIFLFWKLYVS